MTTAVRPIAEYDLSVAEQVALLSDDEREHVLGDLDEAAMHALLYDWSFWARPKQLPPREFHELRKFCWALISGRGFGKTRTGAEQVRAWVEDARDAGEPILIAIIAETAADARDVLVRGPAGILAVSPPEFAPHYEPSKRRLTWPDGSVALLFSGEEPDQLRGPQFHKAWVDELAKYQYPQETWDNLEFALRLGDTPQVVVTTTPRPIPIVRKIMSDPMTIVTTGSTYENIGNLAPTFITRVVQRFENTRLGRQELHAELLDDTPGALWTRALLEANRVMTAPTEFERIAIGVDPSVTSNPETSNECGIIAGGRIGEHAYVLHDISGILSPHQWARDIDHLYHRIAADRVVAEVNNGGDLVETNIRTVNRRISFRAVRAARGKIPRAEPVASLYEQGRVHHVGYFGPLEDQLCTVTPETIGDVPDDRYDALVWLLTDLMIDTHSSTHAFTPHRR